MSAACSKHQGHDPDCITCTYGMTPRENALAAVRVFVNRVNEYVTTYEVGPSAYSNVVAKMLWEMEREAGG